MAETEDRITRLESIEAIRNLIASYGPLADSGNADAIAQIWTDDGEYAVGGFGTAKGHDAIADLIRGSTHQDLMAAGCAHILSPHHIDISGDRARAVGYSIVMRKAGETFVPWRVSANCWSFARAEGKWRAKRRENAPLDGSEAAIEILRGMHVT